MGCARTWPSSASLPRKAMTVSRCCLQSSPTVAMPACPRMRAPAYQRLFHRLPLARPRLVRSRSAFFLSIAKTRTANCSRPFLASASSARVPLSPRFQMLRSSRQALLCGLDRHRLALRSTRSKQRLGPISKQGDRYLRRILVVGAGNTQRYSSCLDRGKGKHARGLFPPGALAHGDSVPAQRGVSARRDRLRVAARASRSTHAAIV